MELDRSNARRRVVIVGGGFGGLAAAHALRHADVDVQLVDRTNHHLFQPLLYQLATGAISTSQCAASLRMSLKRSPNAKVVMAEVTDVDPEQRMVVLDQGERLAYDSLIVACGAETSYFDHPEWRDVTCGLKTLTDALALRNRIYSAFEAADRADEPAVRDAWLTFVVVGGGATGVEVSGAVAVLANHAVKHTFRRIDPANARIVLLDAGDRVMPTFSPALSAKASRYLAELGVTVRDGAQATEIDADGVTIQAGDRTERLGARTVIWAAGVRAAPLSEALARATGTSTDRAGRIEVGANLALRGHPEISVIGDTSSLRDSGDRALPGLATVAIQQAHHVAKAIGAARPGAITPFRYLDKGALAVVGRGRAICAIGRVELSGRVAFATYLGVHLYYLGGGVGRRLGLVTDWISARADRPQSPVIDGALEPSIGARGPARAERLIPSR